VHASVNLNSKSFAENLNAPGIVVKFFDGWVNFVIEYRRICDINSNFFKTLTLCNFVDIYYLLFSLFELQYFFYCLIGMDF